MDEHNTVPQPEKADEAAVAAGTDLDAEAESAGGHDDDDENISIASQNKETNDSSGSSTNATDRRGEQPLQPPPQTQNKAGVVPLDRSNKLTMTRNAANTATTTTTTTTTPNAGVEDSNLYSTSNEKSYRGALTNHSSSNRIGAFHIAGPTTATTILANDPSSSLALTREDRYNAAAAAGEDSGSGEILVYATAVPIERQSLEMSLHHPADDAVRMELPPTAMPARNNGSYGNNTIHIGNNGGGDSSRCRGGNNNDNSFHQHTSLFVENVLLDEPSEAMTMTTLSNQVNSSSIIVAAVPIEDTSTFRALARNRKVQLASVTAILILLVAITLAIVLPISIATNNNNNNSPTRQPPTPSQPPSDSSQLGNTKDLFIQDILPDFTRQKLQNSSSPQSMALEWLWKDPAVTSALPSFRRVQRFALATLALSLTSDVVVDSIESIQKFGWITDDDECKWLSRVALALVCNDDGRYHILDSSSFGLGGEIPPEVSLLTDLTKIDLSNNVIHGSIPSQIGLLTNLEYFALVNANVTGSIPSEIGLLIGLIDVDIRNNDLTGTIPTELGRLSNLNQLRLHANRISGTIPTQVGQLANARVLALQGNLISGTLPTEIGQMQESYVMVLSNNVLTGTLPSELGHLTALELLAIEENDWHGTIPSELGLLSMLNTLFLYTTQLSGSVPPQVCQSARHHGVILVDCADVNCSCGCLCWEQDTTGLVSPNGTNVTALVDVVYESFPT